MLTRITIYDKRYVDMTAKKQHCRISVIKREGLDLKNLCVTAMVVDGKWQEVAT